MTQVLLTLLVLLIGFYADFEISTVNDEEGKRQFRFNISIKKSSFTRE